MKTVLDSINLMAANPILLKDFYSVVFGLEVDAQRSHGSGFFILKGSGCNLLIQDAQKVGGETGNKGFELGFVTEDLEGLAAEVERAGGRIINDRQQMGWGQAITIADPEGHAVNVYCFS